MKTLLAIILAILLAILASCTPQSYIVDTTPYSAQIAANPTEVVVDPADVTPIGGFQATLGAKLLTDQGEVDISNDGISGEVLIDLRSEK